MADYLHEFVVQSHLLMDRPPNLIDTASIKDPKEHDPPECPCTIAERQAHSSDPIRVAVKSSRDTSPRSTPSNTRCPNGRLTTGSDKQSRKSIFPFDQFLHSCHIFGRQFALPKRPFDSPASVLNAGAPDKLRKLGRFVAQRSERR